MKNSNAYSLTVLLMTYNHEKYIERSLDSILRQDRDFPFKILVADDASTDHTLDIIKRTAAEHPEIEFCFLDGSHNLGITKNYQRAFNACDTEYVAVMEGDDYWITPGKLKHQVKFLETNWQCGMCSTNYYVFEEARCHFYLRTPDAGSYSCFTSRDLIADNIIGNFSTCMYRLSALRQLPDALFEGESYDWITNICIGINSMLGFIHKPMSVYRLHEKGTWTMMSVLEKYQSQLEQINTYNRITKNIFDENFSALAAFLRGKIQQEHLLNGLKLTGNRRFRFRALSVRGMDLMPPVILLIIKLMIPPFILRRLGIPK